MSFLQSSQWRLERIAKEGALKYFEAGDASMWFGPDTTSDNKKFKTGSDETVYRYRDLPWRAAIVGDTARVIDKDRVHKLQKTPGWKLHERDQQTVSNLPSPTTPVRKTRELLPATLP